jgi:IS605 OrfB family transposase
MDALRPHEQVLNEESSKSGLIQRIKSLHEPNVSGSLRAGLLQEAAFNLLSYFELEGASFPAPSPKTGESVDSLLSTLLEGVMPVQKESEIKWALRREPGDYSRPIYLSKFRHAPILRSGNGEKLWVAAKIPTQGKTTYLPGEYIRDVSGLPKRNTTESFVLFPIECGRWHFHRFFREGKPTSCRLELDGDEVYFHYAFQFDVEKESPESVLGIDRGRAITGAWCAVQHDGTKIQEGASMNSSVRERLKAIDKEIADTQNRGGDPSSLHEKRKHFVEHTLHHIANRIVELADRESALIAFEDLDSITGATGNSNLDKGLKRSQYGRLYDFVEYKAEERGLRVMEVAPQYTSQTCLCGHTDPDSRRDRDTFRCTECGREAHADLNAARMVALRGVEYLSGGSSGTFGDFVQGLNLN